MTSKRYLLALKMIILTMDELDKKTSKDTFIRITMQYGKRMNITEKEIIEILYTKPFDMFIKKE